MSKWYRASRFHISKNWDAQASRMALGVKVFAAKPEELSFNSWDPSPNSWPPTSSFPHLIPTTTTQGIRVNIEDLFSLSLSVCGCVVYLGMCMSVQVLKKPRAGVVSSLGWVWGLDPPLEEQVLLMTWATSSAPPLFLNRDTLTVFCICCSSGISKRLSQLGVYVKKTVLSSCG